MKKFACSIDITGKMLSAKALHCYNCVKPRLEIGLKGWYNADLTERLHLFYARGLHNKVSLRRPAA